MALEILQAGLQMRGCPLLIYGPGSLAGISTWFLTLHHAEVLEAARIK